MSESFRTAASLAIVGGFLETYTFLLHGHVFANAQTGNIALCGMAIAEANWTRALKYAIPVISFVLGVCTVEWIRDHWSFSKMHWRQSIILIEIILLSGCLYLRGTPQDMLANLLISIACAFQVQAFRKVRGTSYASTMCTGNLRSATVAWRVWNRTGQAEARRQAFCYIGVIAIFLTGSALAVPFIYLLRESAIILPIIFLMAVGLLMSHKPTHSESAQVCPLTQSQESSRNHRLR